MQGDALGVGRRLAVERCRLGFKGDSGQSDFSEKLGLSFDRLCELENKDQLPAFNEISAFAGAGVDVQFILTGVYTISPRERTLLENYRTVDKEDKGRPTIGAKVAQPAMTCCRRPVESSHDYQILVVQKGDG